MTNLNTYRDPAKMRCASCAIRRRAETHPEKFYAKAWKWHTSWCPGWNAYQKALRASQEFNKPAAAKS